MARVEYVVEELDPKSTDPLSDPAINELEELGFSRLGLLTFRPTDEVKLLEQYDGEQRLRAAERLKRARQAMVAPDQSSYAIVDVGRNGTLVYLKTLLDSGTLVETYRLTESAVPLSKVAEARRGEFFSRFNARRRRIVVVETVPLRGLLQAHARNVDLAVARDGGAPSRHDQLGQLLALLDTSLRHDVAVRNRWETLGEVARWGSWVVAALVGLSVASGLTAATDMSARAALGTALWFSLALTWVAWSSRSRIASFLQGSQRLRPPYEPPPPLVG